MIFPEDRHEDRIPSHIHQRPGNEHVQSAPSFSLATSKQQRRGLRGHRGGQSSATQVGSFTEPDQVPAADLQGQNGGDEMDDIRRDF